MTHYVYAQVVKIIEFELLHQKLVIQLNTRVNKRSAWSGATKTTLLSFTFSKFASKPKVIAFIRQFVSSECQIRTDAVTRVVLNDQINQNMGT